MIRAVPGTAGGYGSETFRVTVTRDDGTALVTVGGELDLLTAPELQRAIDEVVADRPRRVVLDLRALEFMGSSGVAMIQRLGALARAYGFTAALVRGNPRVERILAIAGLSDQLQFVDAP